MNQITQTIKDGNANTQIINTFNRPLDVVDICAPKIAKILERLNSIEINTSSPHDRLVPPRINEKHIANAIDAANATEIDKTYTVWHEISNAISGDTSDAMRKSYINASTILNSLYLASFQRKFPEFKIHVITVFATTSASEEYLDDAISLSHLVNFMYLNCQIGIIP